VRSIIILLAAVAISTPVTAGSLTEARVAHKAAVARLREKLLADMNEIIRKEHDRGAGIDYLLKDKKGFEENGVLPLLPKFQPAAREYQIGKRKNRRAISESYRGRIGEGNGRRKQATAPTNWRNCGQPNQPKVQPRILQKNRL